MADELTLGSFNLHWGRRSRSGGYEPFDVVAACAAVEADVLVLQESWRPDADGVAAHEQVASGLGYEVVAAVELGRGSVGGKPRVAGRAGSGRGAGSWELAVLSRVPAVAVPAVPLPQLRLDPVARVLLPIDVELGGTVLRVVGTHLPHLEFGAPLQTRALRAGLPDRAVPAALAGDMNMWGWCIRAMAPRGWRRAVRGRTWPAERPHSAIDHILVTNPVRVLAAEVVGDVVASDHLPVRARLGV